jgi:hypothetical protein
MEVVKAFNRAAEDDARRPLAERPGAAAILAIRPWHYSQFSKFKRQEYR